MKIQQSWLLVLLLKLCFFLIIKAYLQLIVILSSVTLWLKEFIDSQRKKKHWSLNTKIKTSKLRKSIIFGSVLLILVSQDQVSYASKKELELRNISHLKLSWGLTTHPRWIRGLLAWNCLSWQLVILLSVEVKMI